MGIFIYEVKYGTNQSFYANEGDAIQSCRRIAEEMTESRPGLYKLDNYRISLWSDDTMVITDMKGNSLVHMYRHLTL